MVVQLASQQLAAGSVETVDTQERNREVVFYQMKHYLKLEVADSASFVTVKAGNAISFRSAVKPPYI